MGKSVRRLVLSRTTGQRHGQFLVRQFGAVATQTFKYGYTSR